MSIIIPYYNTPVSLDSLLGSIGKHDDVQVIVVDDHSDAYRKEFSECQHKYDHVLFLQTDPEKKGAGAARNAGLRHIEGKWLLFADADDEFLPGWYEIVLEYRESGFDMVFFMPKGRKSDGTTSTRHVLYKKLIDDYCSHRYGGEERLRFRFSVPWSKLIRAEIIQKNGICFDEIRYSNDVMFSAKSGYYSGKVTADRRMIYCVTEHEGSLTADNSGEVYLKRMKVICEREKYLRSLLPKETMDACWRISYVFSAKDTIQKGYGMKTVIELFKLFREYRIPFISFCFKRYV